MILTICIEVALTILLWSLCNRIHIWRQETLSNRILMNSDEELMQPMGPPPRPTARPVALPRGDVWRSHDNGLQEVALQRAPVPHSHPLAALGAHKPVSQRTFQPITGKRLHPAFRNRAKIDAFLEKENLENDVEQKQSEETPVARVQVNSSRAMGIHRSEILAMQAPVPTLSSDDRVAAATDASEWRRLAAQKQHKQSLPMDAHSTEPVDSSLARARARKVKKQVDPTWLQARQDVANRPRDPLEREDERHLREPLLCTRIEDLVASGVFFDTQDAARLRSFAPMTSLELAAERASVPFYDAPWSW